MSHTKTCLALVAAATIAVSAHAGVRDVQISKVDTDAAVVTLFNYGDEDQPLDQFRFCTADADQMFRYSGGITGRTLAPGASLRIHWNDDAPESDPDAIDIADIGGQFATPLGNGPYGLAVYWNAPFSVPDNMADYVQWTDDLDNPGNASADARAGVARDAGLWTGVADWVVTSKETTMITLVGDPDERRHGPDDYETSGVEPCPADLDLSGDVGFGDVLVVLASWGSCFGVCPADLDDSGDVGFGDLLIVLATWGPCP